MQKFNFRIRTRSGTPVDSVTIQAQDREAAERRLRQMYLGCEILECQAIENPTEAAPGLEDFISLISKQEPPRQ